MDSQQKRPASQPLDNEKSPLEKKKEKFPRHGTPWYPEEQEEIYNAYRAGASVRALSERHQRTRGGIKSCLHVLGLIDDEGESAVPAPNFTPSDAALKNAGRRAKKGSGSAKETHSETQESHESSDDLINTLLLGRDHLFITGKAGTGKSTLLTQFCRRSAKRPVVLAPTGIAALNVKGQTIHRFFNFYIDTTIEKIQTTKNKPRKAKLYQNLDTIIIDEVSMVRADLLDCIDAFLRRWGPKAGKPFGGVRMIFIGDLYQLPPVVSQQEENLFSSKWETPYFFSAHPIKHIAMNVIELKKVYRQRDTGFVEILNRIRNNTAMQEDIKILNSRVQGHDENIAHITLASTNAIADKINTERLEDLDTELEVSEAEITGNFGKEYYPTAEELFYKVGAQIMMLNNDSESRWVNGTLGTIEAVRRDSDDIDYVYVKLEDGSRVDVYTHKWEVYAFDVKGEKVVAEPTGVFRQFPFRLAWAITIHKSQGKTFQNVAINLGRGAFAAGQLYVALSRCTSLAGVTLKHPIRMSDIQTDPHIVAFMQEYNKDDMVAVVASALVLQQRLHFTYLRADNAIVKCSVTPKQFAKITYDGVEHECLRAQCLHDAVERLYRLDRITDLVTEQKKA